MRELTEEEKETIYLSLLHLGVVNWTKSSRRMEYAMRYVVQHDDIQNMPVIELYVDVAKMVHCKWNAVERSLRYMLGSMWKDYGPECAQLFSIRQLRCQNLKCHSFYISTNRNLKMVISADGMNPSRNPNYFLHTWTKILLFP